VQGTPPSSPHPSASLEPPHLSRYQDFESFGEAGLSGAVPAADDGKARAGSEANPCGRPDSTKAGDRDRLQVGLRRRLFLARGGCRLGALGHRSQEMVGGFIREGDDLQPSKDGVLKCGGHRRGRSFLILISPDTL
jgi:hypothetical protein